MWGSATCRSKPVDTFLSRTLLKWLVVYSPVTPPPGKIQTAPEMLATGPTIWAEDVARVEQLVARAATTPATAAHPFFGPLTPGGWGRLGWKHLDHHLRQFGCAGKPVHADRPVRPLVLDGPPPCDPVSADRVADARPRQRTGRPPRVVPPAGATTARSTSCDTRAARRATPRTSRRESARLCPPPPGSDRLQASQWVGTSFGPLSAIPEPTSLRRATILSRDVVAGFVAQGAALHPRRHADRR